MCLKEWYLLFIIYSLWQRMRGSSYPNSIRQEVSDTNLQSIGSGLQQIQIRECRRGTQQETLLCGPKRNDEIAESITAAKAKNQENKSADGMK